MSTRDLPAGKGRRARKADNLTAARTLGSWVRIPLKAWMSVCVYSVFVLGSFLATGWSPVQGVLPTVLGLRNWSETELHSGSSRKEREREKEDKAKLWLRMNWQLCMQSSGVLAAPMSRWGGQDCDIVRNELIVLHMIQWRTGCTYVEMRWPRLRYS
jgi:hypothetical protein